MDFSDNTSIWKWACRIECCSITYNLQLDGVFYQVAKLFQEHKENLQGKQFLCVWNSKIQQISQAPNIFFTM